ncbi:acetolactate synthase large subunit [hydrocarbon metagenome]|uniref:Acetolactate synthase large subunit n=1 Tax=hydrocarbon metagenome TaxID=938273 RepID=A0A0W8FUU7_9ZZZZ
MKLSDYFMNYLFERKIGHIFGYQGGSVTHLIDSLYKVNGLIYIQNYHEQASSFCADAYARVRGGAGVAIATSGPGATNLITGIANAFFDSIPCIFITGQVSTHAIKTKQYIRQQGFQETDIVSIVKTITKFAATVLEPENIRYYLEKAFFYAQSGRPGPILIDIPHNVQASEINPQALQSFYDSDEYTSEMNKKPLPDEKVVSQVVAMLAEAKRPVVLAGGGMASVKGKGIFKTFVHACDLPVVGSLRGLDTIDHDDEHFCGFIGSYGNRYANFAVAKSDFLLVLGSRLDERQTGEDRSLFARGAQIVHVDVDPYELNHNLHEAVSVCCDIESFLNALMAEIDDRRFDNKAWIDHIHRWKARYPSYPVHDHTNDIAPNEFLHALSMKVSDNAVVCADVGQNLMWVAQSFCLSGNKQLLCSSGHGAMGYSLPAGIGAHFASPNRQIICVTGDGGIQMNLQELQTVSRERIPLKIFIMNNQSLGMIRTFHEKYFDNRCFGSVNGYANPDFEKLAYAFDIVYTKIHNRDDFDRLDYGLNSEGPHLFEVVLSPTTQVIPEPAPRRAVEDQLPLLNRGEFDHLFES